MKGASALRCLDGKLFHGCPSFLISLWSARAAVGMCTSDDWQTAPYIS